ncbi:MAG: hypothetical protein US83_C0014G0022 [Candidatus Falkowbacteria bacterium GW2011_GWC2_38_22]|uniref:Uncharacterized protein n=1 Tax=Candidatus Falkowbacteria bacterium GW2011_GWE1_38_31 TaxID=1618638 RepID=A0A0G0JSP8_9BACT|nr:MAG: hypothetical protein US73_C0011G0022 [Candidatus Falkowbacteria bacterium GW2011_GWF2_38_1205]KKQ60680.1 MAG: hypothetical protein US83_C0014G0022 [Candidatus Falkowbacteria bacterium GW2011_GWC2_38_22]KKQ62820.1 MAG: hypothetical protein US84_C0011G0022 [Candidatus Falkowbacteria bacterium GW2011_GWF1_38_22]KKQ64932.1 MAG: hypothetical protein US87_C0011G0022 [Candidatus Falkowbacteria bacterium GW2011_GWE2_38_254]KKQ69652.1 MAG: hypothetical protein US91_C0011G0022 [Candidatus Falkowb
MERKIANIAKNTSYFTLALVVQKVISFVFFAFVARNLVPDDLGKYYFAISLTTIFAIFIDLGLSNVLTREVPKLENDKLRVQKVLGSVIAIKLPLAVFSVLSVAFLINLFDYPALTRYLVYISCGSMVLDSFSTTFFATMRGFHNLKYESAASVIFQMITLTFGFIAIRLNLGLPFLMCAMLMGSVFNFLYSSSLLVFKWQLAIKPIYDRIFIKTFFVLTVPFALYGVIQRFYMYLDTVLLSRLASDYHVGLYQIPFKIVFALQFLPLAFVASLYPAFSLYWKSNREQLTISFERALNYLIVISLPISIGTIILADKIILVFKPEYFEAVLPLRIIMASLLFIFINYPIGSLLNACDRQKTNTRNIAIVLACSVVLNFVLIPKFQSVGASITVLVTNILMFMLGIFEAPKIINFNAGKIFIIFLKVLTAGSLMGIFVYFLKNTLPILIVIPGGAIVFAICSIAIGAIKIADIKSVLKTARN